MPDIYKDFSDDLLPENNEPFPYMVLAPAKGGFFRKYIDKLIFELNDSIYIIKRRGYQTKAKKFPLDSICYIEVGAILLYSWIKINGLTENGVSRTATVEYNSVERKLLEPIINTIRGISNDVCSADLIHEKAKFDYLEPLNFKFRYFARISLLIGESVIQSILQPEFKYQEEGKIGWLFSQSVSTAHLTIVTDKELILIRDIEKSKYEKGVTYGGIWQYIPISNIEAVSIKEKTDDILILTLHLSNQSDLERLFISSKKDALLHLKGQSESLIGSNDVF